MSDTYPILREFLLNEYFLKDGDVQAPGTLAINESPITRVVHDIRKIPHADTIAPEDGMPDCAEPKSWYAQFRQYCKFLEAGPVPVTVALSSPGIVKISSQTETTLRMSPFAPLLSTLVEMANTLDGFKVTSSPGHSIVTFSLNAKGINLFLRRVEENSARHKS